MQQYIYCNQAFEPAFDERLGDLYTVSFVDNPLFCSFVHSEYDHSCDFRQCFHVGKELVLNYSLIPAWSWWRNALELRYPRSEKRHIVFNRNTFQSHDIANRIRMYQFRIRFTDWIHLDRGWNTNEMLVNILVFIVIPMQGFSPFINNDWFYDQTCTYPDWSNVAEFGKVHPFNKILKCSVTSNVTSWTHSSNLLSQEIQNLIINWLFPT